MRRIILISLQIYTLAATLHHIKRQASDDVLLASILEIAGQELKPASISGIQPQLRAGVNRQQIRYGPISVRPASSYNQTDSNFLPIFSPLSIKPDPHASTIMAKLSQGLCTNCTVLSMDAYLLYPNNTRILPMSSIKQQHMTIFDVTAKSQNFIALCPGDLSDPNLVTTSATRSPFLDTLRYVGQTWFENPWDLQATVKRGHFIGEDVFMLQAEILNEAAANEDVYIELDLYFRSGKFGEESFKNYISVSGCEPALSFLGNIRTTVTSNATGVIANGTLFSGRAHMSDGGESMNLYLNDKKICTSMALYDGDMLVTGSDCFAEVPVKKGDYLRVDATFDLLKHSSNLSKNIPEHMAVFEIGYSEALAR